MALLIKKDWQMLRNEYRVAFNAMPSDLFKLLLEKVYGNPGGDSKKRGKLDQTDALMFYLARTEPPIPPGPQPR